MTGQPQSIRKKEPSIIPALILLPLGLLILAISLYFGGPQRASLGWISVEGSVINTYIEEYRDADQEVTYTPRIIYEYTVDGQTYTSQQIAFGIEQSYGSQNRADDVLEDFPVGNPVTVYYDPEDPGNAVLDRSAGRNIFFIILGGGLTAWGTISLISVLRYKGGQQD